MKRTKNTDDKGGILGTIITWRVPTNVKFKLLKRGLRKSGLDEGLVRDLAPYHALTRALNDMRKGRVIRKLRREGPEYVFQLTREHLDEKEATYEKEAILRLDASTGALRCKDKGIKQQAEELLEDHLNKRMASDISTLMFRIYKDHSGDLIAIREQGGAYFVPRTHRRLVEQTRTLFDTIGGRLRSFDVRLGSDDTKESVAESMSDYFKQLVQQFKDSCENIDGTTRSDVAERRMQSVADLRSKLELYRGLLSGYADQIADVISDANDDLMRKLAQGAKE